jgi:hypothetical protein
MCGSIQALLAASVMMAFGFATLKTGMVDPVLLYVLLLAGLWGSWYGICWLFFRDADSTPMQDEEMIATMEKIRVPHSH